MSTPLQQIAVAYRSESGWRVVLKKPLQRPPKPEDVPGEELYKLVIQPVRFWGLTIPVYDESLRRKPVAPTVSAADISKWGDSSWVSKGWIENAVISAQNTLQPEQVTRPIPLGKNKKQFEHLVDIIGPNETDEQALSRIESIYEIQRETERLKQVLFVMES